MRRALLIVAMAWLGAAAARLGWQVLAGGGSPPWAISLCGAGFAVWWFIGAREHADR